MPIAEITPEKVSPKLHALRVLDVREPHEIDGPLGAISGATNVPLGELERHFHDLDIVDEPRPFLLVCRSGKRSERACQILQEHGLSRVTNLAGGMIAWNRASLPVLRRRLDSLESITESLTVWLSQVSGPASPGAEARAEARIGGWLQEAGGSRTSLTPALLDHVLTRLEETLVESGPPPDLDLAVEAYRRDLSTLIA